MAELCNPIQSMLIVSITSACLLIFWLISIVIHVTFKRFFYVHYRLDFCSLFCSSAFDFPLVSVIIIVLSISLLQCAGTSWNDVFLYQVIPAKIMTDRD